MATFKDKLSHPQKTKLRNEIPKWRPIITNTSRLPVYTNKQKITNRLTFDRTIYPKRKPKTPTKTQSQITKKNTLNLFGFREKASTKLPKLSHQPLDNTTQTHIDNMRNFNSTNKSRGNRLTKLDPNYIRILHININGLDIGNGDYSLIYLCQNFQEKGVDIVCITKTNVHWERSHIHHYFKKTLHDACSKNNISFLNLNPTSNGIQITNQEALQCSP